jgi:hypothetical protein
MVRAIAEGEVRTYDMGGKDSTLDVAKAVADYAMPSGKLLRAPLVSLKRSVDGT